MSGLGDLFAIKMGLSHLKSKEGEPGHQCIISANMESLKIVLRINPSKAPGEGISPS